MATKKNPVTDDCELLAGNDPTKDADFESGNDSLIIKYKSPEKREDSCKDKPKLKVIVKCDKDAKDMPEDEDVEESDDKCTSVISFKHKTGCKNGSLSAIWKWFENNKWAMFALFVIVGSLVCFFGRTLFKPVLFISGIIVSVVLIWIIFYSTFLNQNTKTWVGWVVLAGAVLFGCVIGCLLTKFAKIGAFVVAAWGGFSLGLLLYNTIIYKMDSDVGFWLFTIGCALACGILALFFFDHILILATALGGSFLVINGIGLVAGRYDNPFTIAQKLNKGVIDHIDPVFYAYLAGNIVLFAMGALF